MPAAPKRGLVERLRDGSHGYDEWRVQDPKDGSYCIAYSWPETMNPEREARAWLADHKARFPNGLHSDYVVACVRVLPPKDRLMAEAADELVRLHGQMETLGRWIVEALKVLDTIDPDDLDESERLMTLIKGGEMLSMSALAPQMWAKARKAAGKGPTCNVLRPWEQLE